MCARWCFRAAEVFASPQQSSLLSPSAIGHASMLVRLAGKNMLFDPVFSPSASPVSFAGAKRIVPPPIAIADLPRIDLVMVSHNHYDHLDADTVQQLAAMPQGSPRLLVPKGLKAGFAALGIRRVNDTNQTLWGVWILARCATHRWPADPAEGRGLGAWASMNVCGP